MDKNFSIILLGPQGSGKGTQAEFLTHNFNFGYIAGGDISRKLATRKDELGRKVKTYVDSGDLIPDEIMMEGLKSELETYRGKWVIIDAVPRNRKQLIAMIPLLLAFKRRPVVIILKLPRKQAIERLVNRKICESCNFMPPYPEVKEMKDCPKCGGILQVRADDALDAIDERLNTYERETIPMIREMKAKGFTVIEVDGRVKPLAVYKDIKTKLKNHLL